jgi:hypothetical protein
LDDTLVGSTPFKINVGSGEVTHIELRLTGHETRKVALSSRTPTVTIRLTPNEPEPAAATIPAVTPSPTVTPAPQRTRPVRKAKATPKPSPAPAVTPPVEDTPANTADGLRDPWAD